jgi:hypothetical protein
MNSITTRNETVELGKASEAKTAVFSRRDAIKRTAMLFGIALSPAWLDGVAQAQAAAQAAKPGGAAPTGNAAGMFLSAGQMAVVAAAAERILPKTDTPGANDVGVPAFIDVMVGRYMSTLEQNTFTDGLADLGVRSQRTFGKTFLQLTPDQQVEVLTAVANESQTKQKTFFHQLKELTVIGYFTAEEVGRNVTHFEPIPGRWQACVPISETGNRSWTR